ncbi:heterokaryon incompatibility protein-domain-containing protein [Podospora conica]|nr:heterokaryon incompatibility protein-domain-containing protein [Schizothecium conicum]
MWPGKIRMLTPSGLDLPSDLIPEQSILSDSTTEAKGQVLLRAVERILDIALPKPSAPALVEKEDSPADKIHIEPQDQLPGDALYSSLRYVNQEVGREQIRLLELLPGPPADTVQGRLFVIDSPRHHEYEALSYVWGSQTIQHAITLNGRPHTVGTNLHDALVSLRLPDQVRYLWVDAVCINQMDDEEKNAQVCLMGKVFHQAQTVAIFLGMPTNKSYALVDFLHRSKRTEHVAQEDALAIINEVGMDAAAVVASFVELCDREWWGRVWVLQEHYLARRRLWYIGSRFFGGRNLRDDFTTLHSALCALLDSSQESDTSVSQVIGSHTVASTVSACTRTGVVVIQMNCDFQRYQLPSAMLFRSGRLATHPSDYIYGLRELLEPHFRQIFAPDYTLPVPTLFEKVAAWVLLMEGWVDMFWQYPFHCRMGGGPGKPEEPSWVPDFSQRAPLITREVEPGLAEKMSKQPSSCFIMDRVLYVEGCHLDEIQEVVDIPTLGGFQVLQAVWQLDRAYYTNQRRYPTASHLGGLLSWSSFQPEAGESSAALCWPWRVGATRLLLREFDTALWPPSATSVVLQRLKESCVSPSKNNEYDLVSACIFDFENLDSQLRVASEAPEPQQGLEAVLSTYGDNDIVHDDIIAAMQTTDNGPVDVETFRFLVALVRRAAKTIHSWVQVSNCENVDPNNRASGEGNDVVDPGQGKALTIDEPEWSIQVEEVVLQFRGRQSFATKRGFLGLLCLGVSDVRVGDQVVLMDGLILPLVARPRPDSRLKVVGCAKIRGVEMACKVEGAELWDGKSAGPRRVLEFV